MKGLFTGRRRRNMHERAQGGGHVLPVGSGTAGESARTLEGSQREEGGLARCPTRAKTIEPTL